MFEKEKQESYFTTLKPLRSDIQHFP